MDGAINFRTNQKFPVAGCGIPTLQGPLFYMTHSRSTSQIPQRDRNRYLSHAGLLLWCQHERQAQATLQGKVFVSFYFSLNFPPIIISYYIPYPYSLSFFLYFSPVPLTLVAQLARGTCSVRQRKAVCVARPR